MTNRERSPDLRDAQWIKSSRSSGNGGQCVEVALNLVGAHWRKSSRSTDGGGNCVEVADNLPNIVGVQDSKDPSGPALAVKPGVWAAFAGAVKADSIR